MAVCLLFIRSHVRMTDAEVAKIIEDPASVPDSDDEEDNQAWKVGTCM